MFSVEVYTMIAGERITRFLAFETYGSAANCIYCLKGREPGIYSPEDYFMAAKIYDHKKGELIGPAMETDWVLSFLEKTC